MIRLFTGLPGHGKTLRVVAELAEMRQQDASRPLYVRGITGLSIDHASCEGHDWQSLPDGSIVVIDEAQQIFPVRRGGDTPAYVSALATHRHRGIDIWLITQHPSLIDAFARKLIDRHTHVFRIASQEFAQVYQWNEVQEDPRSMAARQLSESFAWKYPKELYGAYSSAVLHTAKGRIPKKLVVLAGVILTFFLCVVVLWWWVGRQHEKGAAAILEQEKLNLQPASALQPVNARQPMDAAAWLAQYAPRIPYRPESAPAYDRLLGSSSPPRIVCVDVEGLRCQCYTEQATPWQGIRAAQCRELARTGIYHPSYNRTR